MSANDGGISSYRSAPFHQGLLVLVPSQDMGAGIDYVSKHHRRAKEHVILTDHTGINGNIVLYLHIATQANLGRNNHILPEVATLPYPAVFHDMSEVPDPASFSNRTTLVYYGCFMCKIFFFHIRHLQIQEPMK
jgi:hypothetical protein